LDGAGEKGAGLGRVHGDGAGLGGGDVIGPGDFDGLGRLRVWLGVGGDEGAGIGVDELGDEGEEVVAGRPGRRRRGESGGDGADEGGVGWEVDDEVAEAAEGDRLAGEDELGELEVVVAGEVGLERLEGFED